ncbi:MAG TPA: MraY family glycosyltransferase, partial [Elusimicrobiota bacterium]|nr:MraY family glycosyltransferase [Elusimicrobiota bacterium]
LGGGTIIFLVGLADDMRRPGGLDWKTKMLVQVLAAGFLMAFGIRIRFIQPPYLAYALTGLWVVGICNAFNIVDIMDGLAASQAAVAAFAFLVISLPSEEVYVNFAAATILGVCLGFLPWNFSTKSKIFLGDSGSLLLGFVLSALALGTNYSRVNPLGVYAPLFILLVPIFDTLFVMVLRLRKGHSPFLGSKDHFALRLERMGYHRHHIVALCAAVSGILAMCAFLVTRVTLLWSIWIYTIVVLWAASVSWRIAQVDMG